MKTEDVIFQESDSIVLNCTYQKESWEILRDRDIIWQKKIDDAFEDVAVFSPPGGQEPYICMDMHLFYKNRIELISPSNPLSAVMIIKDPLCKDQGIYKCWIGYFADSSAFQTSRSVVTFKGSYVLSTYAKTFVFVQKTNFSR